MACTLTDFVAEPDTEAPALPALPEGDPTVEFASVRVVAFDLDNTLIDIVRVKTRAAEAAAWALADAGLDVNPAKAAEAILQTAYRIGIDREDVVEHYLRDLLGAPDHRLVHVGQHAYERAEDESAVPYPRVHATLLELSRRGFRIALITDAPRRRALRRLQATRLLSFFSHVVTLEDTTTGKVDARPYEIAARAMGVAPREILMVGDNPVRDVGCARAIGCRTVLAEYGLQPQFASESPEHRPHARIRWPDHLLRLLPAAAPVAGRGRLGGETLDAESQ